MHGNFVLPRRFTKRPLLRGNDVRLSTARTESLSNSESAKPFHSKRRIAAYERVNRENEIRTALPSRVFRKTPPSFQTNSSSWTSEGDVDSQRRRQDSAQRREPPKSKLRIPHGVEAACVASRPSRGR